MKTLDWLAAIGLVVIIGVYQARISQLQGSVATKERELAVLEERLANSKSENIALESELRKAQMQLLGVEEIDYLISPERAEFMEKKEHGKNISEFDAD